MRIAIVGIGGVGGYYGGLLAKRYSGDEDVEIIFIARGDHLKQIKKNGLKLITQKETFTVRPDLATNTPSGCGMFDCVIFCVKAYGLEESAQLLSHSIDENTVVISLLNGVDNADRLSALLAKGIIFNGCVYIGAHIVRPGVVQQAGSLNKLFFGNESNNKMEANNIENILKDAHIDAEYRTDIENIVWEKYVLISAFATATTYLNKTMRGVIDSEKGKELLNDLLTEVFRVSEAKRIELPKNIRKEILAKVSTFPHEIKTSMQMDFEKENKTELETFTGYIVREAGKHGLSVPTYNRIYAALKKQLQV
ncbi:MAG: 2-dehydropantoate 2-reductase [Deltaproteobacteria bacterium]|jgi:2-dehydropantoate 2-reductase|nr:2-dehydropantoate 2-reductase [Deltaproteobacteria bacterium]